MPFTLVKQSEKTTTSLHSPSAQHRIDIWRKSFLSVAKLNKSKTKPADDTVKPPDTAKVETGLKKVQVAVLEPVEEEQTSIQLLEPERKEEMGFEQMKSEPIEQHNIELVDKMELDTLKPPLTVISFHESSEAKAPIVSGLHLFALGKQN